MSDGAHAINVNNLTWTEGSSAGLKQFALASRRTANHGVADPVLAIRYKMMLEQVDELVRIKSELQRRNLGTAITAQPSEGKDGKQQPGISRPESEPSKGVVFHFKQQLKPETPPTDATADIAAPTRVIIEAVAASEEPELERKHTNLAVALNNTITSQAITKEEVYRQLTSDQLREKLKKAEDKMKEAKNIAIDDHKMSRKKFFEHLKLPFVKGATEELAPGDGEYREAQGGKDHMEVGLSSQEAAARLQQHGPNRLSEPKEMSAFMKWVLQMVGGFAILMWGAAVLCAIAYGLDHEVPDNLYLTIILVLAILVTGTFAWYMENQSSEVMAGFKKMMPTIAKALRDGEVQDLDATLLVPGDIVFLKAGEKIPADMRVMAAHDLKVDMSNFTGEPEAVERAPRKTSDNPLETENLVFAGTVVEEGQGTCVVILTGDRTFIGNLKNLASGGTPPETPIQAEIHHFVKVISVIALGLGVACFLIGLRFYSPKSNMVLAIGIIVANVPEGLIATVTLCLTLAARKMAARHVLVKDLKSVETLGSTNTICSDKTGTLTLNRMTVVHCFYDNQVWNTNPDMSVDEEEKEAVAAAAALAAQDEGEQLSCWARFRRCQDCRPYAWLDDERRAQYNANPAKWEPLHGPKSEEDLATEAEINASSAANDAANSQVDARLSGLPRPDKKSDAFLRLFSVAALCSKAKYVSDDEPWSCPEKAANVFKREVESDATEKGIFKFAEHSMDGYTFALREYNKLTAKIPFNSKDKFAIHICRGNLQSAVEFLKTAEAKDRKELEATGRARHAQVPAGHFITMKGASEKIIGWCETVVLGDGRIVPFTQEMKQAALNKAVNPLADNGERVLGMCYMDLDPAQYPTDFKFNVKDNFRNFPTKGMTFVGLVALMDPPKRTVKRAVEVCTRAGIRVFMVTGDYWRTAKAIAKMVTIIRDPTIEDIAAKEGKPVQELMSLPPEKRPPVKAIVISGEQVERLADSDWAELLSHEQIVFARTTPQQKLKITTELQKLGAIVGMTGDGVNDSPALKNANIGIAMKSGSEISQEAAKMVLLDNNFASIVGGIEEGRLIFDNLKKSIAFTLEHLLPELTPALCYLLFQIPLPLTTILILAIDLGTDLAPAVALAYEYPEADIMKRRPRNATTDRMVGRALFGSAYVQIGLFESCGVLATYFAVMAQWGYSSTFLYGKADEFSKTDDKRMQNALKEAQSACYISICLMQIAGVITRKTRMESSFKTMRHLLANVGLLYSILFSLAVAVLVVYCPGFQEFFGAYPVGYVGWLTCLPFCVFIILYEEVRKYLLRQEAAVFKVAQAELDKIPRSPLDPAKRAPEGWVTFLTYY